jgi:hypothetical protein
MKQLKVIVNDTASLAIAENGGYVTANFVNPVEIKKGSLICLDKFNATSKNISQNFAIVQQTFEVICVEKFENLAGIVLTQTVTIPSATYATIVDYMATINNNTNASAISAYRPLPAGVYSPNNWYNTQSQMSLGMTLEPAGTGGVFSKWSSIIYGLSALSSTPTSDWIPSANMAVNVDGFHYSTDTLDASITAGVPCCQGGGIAFNVELALLIITPSSFRVGFSSNNGAKLGGKIARVIGSTNLCMIDDNGTVTEILNSPALFPAAYGITTESRFTLLQKDGNFGFSYCDDINNNNAPVTVYGITGQYAGKMGTWNYAETYTATADLLIGPPAFANMTYTPVTGGTIIPPITQNTATGISFANNSNQLALVLGFASTAYIFSPYLGSSVSFIESPAPFNINQLRSAFELAIEIVDIPLKTYFAQTGNNARNYGRQNVICYFTPNPSNETEGLYSFANPVHQWLSIDNLADTTIHSLSFRIYNPYNNQSFISNSMGFNLLIKSPDEMTTF